jgi:hypothetical protein
VSKRQTTKPSRSLPDGWVHRLALFLVLVLLFLYVGALLAHVMGEARFYVMPEVDLWQRATSIFWVLVWGTVLVVAGIAFQKGHPLAVEPWRRWPWISRGAAVLVAAAVFKHVAILVSHASLAAALHLETATLLLRGAGWALVALGLLRGEAPLARALGAKGLRKDKG